MPSNFTKQLQYLTQKYFNDGTGDASVGGTLTSAPANTGASQGIQDIPGDRIVLGAADALALSNNSVGNLYGGLYQYVATLNNSTSGPARGHAAFRDLSANDNLYRVTSDNAANITTTALQGAYINNITKGNYWWIQVAGKATLKFLSTVTTAGAIGGGVYVATTGGSNNNSNAADIGAFDTAVTAANATVTIADSMLRTYVGYQEVAASNNNLSVAMMDLRRVVW